MGNCQAIDAASLVMKHPDGRIERLYYPVTASEVMRMNQGHYVTLIIPLSTVDSDDRENNDQTPTVRFSQLKLLRPTDTLSLGHAYRLVTTEEVMKVLRAKKYAKTKKQQQSEQIHSDMAQILSFNQTKRESQRKMYEGRRQERRGGIRVKAVNPRPVKPKTWRPSLNSISEGGVELHSK